jgi:hypothetical protein
VVFVVPVENVAQCEGVVKRVVQVTYLIATV